jgi:hypothetical protein
MRVALEPLAGQMEMPTKRPRPIRYGWQITVRISDSAGSCTFSHGLGPDQPHSFRLDTGRLDDRPPFLNLCNLQGGKLLRILLLPREDFLPNFRKALTDSSVS